MTGGLLPCHRPSEAFERHKHFVHLALPIYHCYFTVRKVVVKSGIESFVFPLSDESCAREPETELRAASPRSRSDD